MRRLIVAEVRSCRRCGDRQSPVTEVTLYWRPWCPYCVRLRWQLRRARVPVREINIWEDADAAARVRDITGGDEVVPTVAVGLMTLVNPTRDQVLVAVRAHAPPPRQDGRS